MNRSDLYHAADRLLDAIDRCGSPVCVGIDPVFDRLPDALRNEDTSPVCAIRSFSLGVLDAVAEIVPCVKFQSACYERYRAEGVRVLDELIGEAKKRGFEVILDAKRGDIGITAEHYAAAAFGDESETTPTADWLTVNAYLGADGIEPFLREGRGVFALVRTSNPGGDALQGQKLQSGETIAESVAKMIAIVGDRSIGKRGYSALGAVVGATKPRDAEALRAIMPRQIFLVPGYGAQGGGAKDVLPCFHSDDAGTPTGAIVTASRSVIYAFQPGEGNWTVTVRDAAKRFAEEIANV